MTSLKKFFEVGVSFCNLNEMSAELNFVK